LSNKVVEGFVEVLHEKSGTNARGAWTAYSIKVQNADGTVDPTWYGFGFEKPKFAKGDYIRFEAEMKADGKGGQFVPGTGSKPKNPPAKPAAPQAQGQGGYNGPRKGGGGGYPPRKPIESKVFGQIGQNNTEDDIRRMSYTAARSAALEAISILLTHDGLPMSAAKTKAGQAERFKEITAAIDKLTVEYFFDAAMGRKLESVADAGSKESRVAPLPTDKPSAATPSNDADTLPDDADVQDDDAPPADDDNTAF
jgi:hypothetical protein